jgi:Bacteriophage head to tail connecting protein
MADLENYVAPRIVSDWEAEKARKGLKLFSELTTYRNVHAADWEDTAALIDTNSRNTFFYGSYNFPGTRRTQQQIDGSGALALQTFVAIINSIVTPRNILWHGLGPEADTKYLLKDRKVKLWYEATAQKLFDARYAATADFFSQNMANWRSVGAYGNGTMFIDKLDTRFMGPSRGGLRYKGLPLGETFFAENHQGQVTTMVRWFRGTAAQAAGKWGAKNLPQQLWEPLKQDLQTPFDFLHIVCQRDEDEYDPSRLDARGKPFCSYYVSMQGKCLMPDIKTGELESGYRTFPFAVSRFAVHPGECYGRGPATYALPSLKTLNAMKSTSLKQLHRNADPIYLLADDGALDAFSTIPGAFNKGGVSSDGKPLVHTLPTGDIQASKEALAEERGLIEDLFLARIFKTLAENPSMTATQVLEIVNERGMLVAPVLGGQFGYVAQMAEREMDLMMEMRKLDPMPPLLREARGSYEVTDTSPLAKLQRAGEAAGFQRWTDTLKQLAIDTQDPSWLDPVSVERAAPALADINGVPTDWTATQDEMAQKKKARAQTAQRQEQIQALPAQAAMVKANAAAAKSGQPQQPGFGPQ